MALALYRKYRPARFADVVGQEHVTEPLRTALEAGRINHAYLFSGPRGCGKTSSARILARSLNCVQGPTPDPCGVCAPCIALAPEGPGSIDVVELDAASHGGVDDARELRDRAFYAPAESRYRVFIVDEAHMVTTQGFNALLKIVEEPPDHLVFVFATTEPEKVLPTIRSRTHHYPFRLIPPSTLRGLLERICADEGAIVAPAVFPLVLRAGGGSARDTLSVLDQLLAGAGPEGVTYERAVALLGVTDVALIDDVVDALAAGDRAAVFQAVDRLVEAGLDPRRFAADLLQRLRDLTLVQAIPDAAQRGLVDVAADEVERMVEQAARLGPATLVRYGEILHAGLIEMRGATAPRLLLELLCARMLLPAASTSEPSVLERLERLERIERRASIAPGPVPHGETAAAPPPESGETRSGAARRTFVRASRAGASPDRTEEERRANPGAEPPSPVVAPPDDTPSLSTARSEPADAARPPVGGPLSEGAGSVDRPVADRVGGAEPPHCGPSGITEATSEAVAPDEAMRGRSADAASDADRGGLGTTTDRSAAGHRGDAAGPHDRTGIDKGRGDRRRGGAEPTDRPARPVVPPGETHGDRLSARVEPGVDRRAAGRTGQDRGDGDRRVGGVEPGVDRQAAGRTGQDRGDGDRRVGGVEPGVDRRAAGRTGHDRVDGDPRSGGAEPGADRPAPARPGDDRPSTDHPAEADHGDQHQADEPPSRPVALDAAAVRRVWSEILAAAKQRSRSTGALMVNATVRAVEGDVLVLAIGSEPLARRLSEQRNTDIIADALYAVLGVRWRVRCDHGDVAPPSSRPVAPRASQPPQRPARPAPTRPASARRSAPDDGVPLPPEPPDEDAPPEDEEAMMAEAAADAPSVRRDPEEVAIELLSVQLGATTIERR